MSECVVNENEQLSLRLFELQRTLEACVVPLENQVFLDLDGNIPNPACPRPSCAVVIRKTDTSSINKEKKCDIKYLEPPKAHGRIVIIKGRNSVGQRPPPVIRREPKPTADVEPVPVKHYERPPTRPACINEQLRIPGDTIIPKRQIIVEVLAPEPANPQGDEVNAWKPYTNGEIEICLEQEPSPPIEILKNIIYKWSQPSLKITQTTNVSDVPGITDPDVYAREHSNELRSREELPQCIQDNLEKNLPAPSSQEIKYTFFGEAKALEELNKLRFSYERLVQNETLRRAFRDHFNTPIQ